MRLLLDHHISKRAARQLIEAGYDVTTAEAEGVGSASDEEVWAKAIEQGRVVVTYNYCDFIALYQQFWDEGRIHPGLVLVYTSMIPSNDVGALVRSLRALIESRADLTNQQQILLPA